MSLLRQVIATLLAASLSGLLLAAPSGKFFSLSDIHFDPFASCHVGLHSCPLIEKLQQAPATEWHAIFEKEDKQPVLGASHDTNYALLESTLEEVHRLQQQQSPQFTLILGDFLAHHFRAQFKLYAHDNNKEHCKAFIKKTLAFLTLEIREAIPQGDIYPVVGNNDSYTGDYSVVPNGAFLKDLSKTWLSLIQDTANQRRFQETFPLAGYYAVDVPGNAKQRILILDTVLFSTASKSAASKAAATQQLRWFHEELTKAKQQQKTVIVAFHIPVGVDVYKTVLGFLSGVKHFWRQEYADAFNKELALFPDTIRAVLAGHIHLDSLEIGGLNPNMKMTVSFTPAISPIFGNNPTFKVYTYDEHFNPAHSESYFYSAKNPAPYWGRK